MSRRLSRIALVNLGQNLLILGCLHQEVGDEGKVLSLLVGGHEDGVLVVGLHLSLNHFSISLIKLSQSILGKKNVAFSAFTSRRLLAVTDAFYVSF